MPQLQRQRTLAVVVGCTQNKTLPVTDDLLLRNFSATHDRCNRWAAKVQEDRRARRSLRDLYKGQQWRSTLALEKFAGGHYADVQLWVVSAGLGLRSAEEHAPGYSASFTGGVDAVGSSLRERQTWWTALQAEFGTRRMADVRSTVDEMLIVLSPPYLAVVKPELDAIDDDGVALMTSELAKHPRGVSSRGLQSELGGSDQTLNQRAAVRLLDLAASRPIGTARVREEWASWAEQRRVVRTYDRTSLSDEALLVILRGHVTLGRRSATHLLRQLRSDGFACEQKRFHRLYAQVLAGAA